MKSGMEGERERGEREREREGMNGVKMNAIENEGSAKFKEKGGKNPTTQERYVECKKAKNRKMGGEG